MSLNLYLTQQGNPVVGQPFRYRALLVEVRQVIGVRQDICIGMSRDIDARAALPCANFKPGPVVRERVRPLFVRKANPDEKLRRRCVTIITIANLCKIVLVPLMGALRGVCIAFIEIVNAITKGITRTSQVPREDMPGKLRIEKRRSIIPVLIRAFWLWLSIEMDASIFMAHFPVILLGIPTVSDARKEALDSRSIEGRSVRVMRDWNQV